jgi:predicted phage tail protein
VRKITLYGHLAKKFGRHHELDVRSAGEAIRALCVNFSDFRKYLMENNAPGYHVRVGREYRDIEGLNYPADDTIRIIPAVAGAGKGLGSILLGIAIIGGAFLTGGASLTMLGNFAVMPTLVTTSIGAMALNVGMSLILGGVAQALAPSPKSQDTAPAQNSPSYAFNGPINTVTQGNPVPVCYGRLVVGSQVVSAGLSTTDIAV